MHFSNRTMSQAGWHSSHKNSSEVVRKIAMYFSVSSTSNAAYIGYYCLLAVACSLAGMASQMGRGGWPATCLLSRSPCTGQVKSVSNKPQEERARGRWPWSSSGAKKNAAFRHLMRNNFLLNNY